jgi:DNA-directed RNA polymerase beta subunit
LKERSKNFFLERPIFHKAGLYWVNHGNHVSEVVEIDGVSIDTLVGERMDFIGGGTYDFKIQTVLQDILMSDTAHDVLVGVKSDMGEILHNFKTMLKLKLNKSKTNIDVIKKELTKFLTLVDCSKNNWISKRILLEFDKNINEMSITEAIDNISLIEPPFESTKPENQYKLMDHTDSKFKQKLFDPKRNKYYKNDIAVGYIYFMKLVHRASDKMFSRSFGLYNKNTYQPLGGKSSGKSHKLGEMEIWALLAHGCEDLVQDLMTTCSDSAGKKNKLLASILQNPDLKSMESDDDTPQTYKMLEAYMKVLGINIVR